MHSKPTLYTYDADNITALESCLSPDRLEPYYQRVGKDKTKALRLYLWNTSLSESLYGSLQGLEIGLRNSINRELTAKHSLDWYKNPILFRDIQHDKINRVIAEFDKQRPITQSDVVSRLSFGFWADILHYEMYEQLWREAIHRAFPNRPKGTRRNNIAPMIKRLKDLRNRIAHHEPILRFNLQQEHNDIIEILSWICPVTSDWIAKHSRFETVWKNPPD